MIEAIRRFLLEFVMPKKTEQSTTKGKPNGCTCIWFVDQWSGVERRTLGDVNCPIHEKEF